MPLGLRLRPPPRLRRSGGFSKAHKQREKKGAGQATSPAVQDRRRLGSLVRAPHLLASHLRPARNCGVWRSSTERLRGQADSGSLLKGLIWQVRRGAAPRARCGARPASGAAPTRPRLATGPLLPGGHLEAGACRAAAQCAAPARPHTAAAARRRRPRRRGRRRELRPRRRRAAAAPLLHPLAWERPRVAALQAAEGASRLRPTETVRGTVERRGMCILC